MRELERRDPLGDKLNTLIVHDRSADFGHADVRRGRPEAVSQDKSLSSVSGQIAFRGDLQV